MTDKADYAMEIEYGDNGTYRSSLPPDDQGGWKVIDQRPDGFIRWRRIRIVWLIDPAMGDALE